MTDPATDAPSTPPIDHDLPCAVCGHNLKGLSPGVDCPECGQPVARSYAPPLAQSDPAWLRRQATTMFPLAAVGLMHFHPASDRIAVLVMFPMTTLAALVAVWAVWRLTTPDPAATPNDRDTTLHRALRLAILVYAGARVVWFLNLMAPRAAAGAGLVSLGCLIAAAFIVCYILLRFARRSNDPSLVRHARLVLWTFPISQTSERLAPFLVLMLARNTDPDSRWVFGIESMIYFILGIAVFVLLLLLGRLHEVLRRAADAAESRPIEPVTTPAAAADVTG